MAAVAPAAHPTAAAAAAAAIAAGQQHDLHYTADVVKQENRLSQVSGTSSNGSRRAQTHIGPWQLGCTLGRGSSGRVRLAKHSETGQLAAVKIVPKELMASDQRGAGGLPYGIEREVIIMKLIQHPNIMALYDVWENKGELYLVLEYIEGGELFDYLINKGRLSEREAVHYFKQICWGVDYCHQFNICHRDLKPENLLLDKRRNIKIADFGMAALETQGRMLETSCGSPHYASPEIVAGKTYHGAPSDIWSCGVILFALLTGHLPFDDDNIRNLLLKVQSGVFDMPQSLSPEARDLISRMLVVDPQKRITMRQILNHDLLKKYSSKEMPKENKEISRLVNASRPVKSAHDIDREILRNLEILWHRETRKELIEKLLSPEPNAEKTFYCLLLEYRKVNGNPRTSTRKQKGLPRVSSRRSIASRRSNRSGRSIHSHSHKQKRSVTRISAPSSPARRAEARPQSSPKQQPAVPPPPTFDEDDEVAKRESKQFADLLDQVFFEHSRATSAQLPPTAPLGNTEDRRVLSDPGYQPRVRQLERAAPIAAVASLPQTLDPFVVDGIPSIADSKHSYMLPMIFEEDRFVDALEHEMSLKLSKRRKPVDTPGSAAGEQLKQISEVAPTHVAPPVRQAPHAPQTTTNVDVENLAKTLLSTPVAQNSESQSDHTVGKTRENNGLDQAKARLSAKASRFSTLDRAAATAGPSSKRNSAQTPAHESPSQPQPQLQPQPQPQPHGMRDRIHLLSRSKPLVAKDENAASKPAEKREVSGDKTPKFLRWFSQMRKVSPEKSEQPADKRTLDKTRTAAAKSATDDQRRAPASRDKENAPIKTLPAAAASAAAPRRSETKSRSRAAPAPASISPNEPHQSWFMRMFKLSEPLELRHDTLPTLLSVESAREVLVSVLQDWSPYGVQIKRYDPRTGELQVQLSPRNPFQLRGSRLRIIVKAMSQYSGIVLTQVRGSRRSFYRFVEELELALKSMDVLNTA